MIYEDFSAIGEYAASGAFEEPERGLFYRKALGIRRYYEKCNLYKYEGTPLYPSGAHAECMVIYPHYLNGLEVDPGHANFSKQNRDMYEAFTKDFFKYKSKVPEEHAVAGNMYCHSMPNYERIIKEGLDSYAERIKKISDADLKDGLLHIYEGIKCYIHRCVDYLVSVNADSRLINALKKVPLQKADNIYEAIVSWNFVMYLDNCDNLGCPAKGLYDFYQGENIVPLLENLYGNLDANNGYSMALHTGCSELTLQCLKAAKGKRRPIIELFVDENTPGEIWNAAFETVRTQGGQPAFYNPKVLLGGLKKKFSIPDADLKAFCGGGCTESEIAGMSCVGSLDAGINLLLILEREIYDKLPECAGFDELYSEYIAAVKSVTDEITEKISLSQAERAKYNPVPMRTFLTDDCIDSATEFYSGGARYNWSIVNFAGMINVIDSMLAIKDLVFDKKALTAKELIEKLKNNDSQFLSACRKSKKAFGTDDDVVNSFAKKLSHDIYSMLDGKKPYIGSGFIPASIQFMSQVYAGKNIGATPDGRAAGAPLCDSLGAIFGKDTKGPTALLKSVASLSLEKAVGTPVLNFNTDESWHNDVLKALILSYMKLGGIQLQISCVSEKTLKAAYKDPDSYRNLVVRVGGYSEYFYRLSDELKKMIIDRTVQKL